MVSIGGGYVTGPIDLFTKFEVDILYEAGTADPDSCMISFILGKMDDTASIGSEYTIDYPSLGGSGRISEVEPDFLMPGNPYPNPADNYMNIPFELK